MREKKKIKLDYVIFVKIKELLIISRKKNDK